MTKGELMHLVFNGNTNGVDTAVPQTWFNKVQELGIDPAFFVWSYQENKVFGSPVNLLEEYAKQIIAEVEKQVAHRA